MLPSLSTCSLLFIVVFVAGFVDAIAGGGGLITVPAYLLAGVPPIFTLGTNKLVSTAGTIVSAIKFILHRRVIWTVAIVGIPCSLSGAAIGAHMVAILPQTYVRSIILICLPIAAALTLMPRPRHQTTHLLHWRSQRLWFVVPLLSGAIGWYDGFFGPGTGSLLMLALYGLTGMSLSHAAGVSRLFNLASNVAALMIFVLHRKVIYLLALPLAVASIAGHYCGSHLAIRKGDGLIRIMLIVTVSLLMIFLVRESI